ncbi:hypothetical protein [Galbitalea soli]|uniref:Glycosyltransferase RgtA/B/C/D-like domain-containing protein n=1 Tax=Galbitalea soli TaxID=1268042 RepID=A0A7C9PPN9_9MICO|nr:hypothetical protein [Galbitalea soli]NEM92407.1 hypothetical protein [Galbitalea soli]NYJ29441.1 hypothetical protein [Galbitalea soli]
MGPTSRARGADARARAFARRLPVILAEAAGLLVALAIAAVVVANVADSPRAFLLYYDGDSVLPALVRGSLAAGQPQDWAMSTVLFLPELTVYLALSAVGLGVKAAFAAGAVVNLAALYAALRYMESGTPHLPRARFAAGAGGHTLAAATHGLARRLPRIAATLAAFAVFAGLALTETSADRNALELASLLTTSTYYSATVIALVVIVGLVLRTLRGGGRRHRSAVTGALAAVTGFATLSNPIVIAWAVVPVVVVLGILGAARIVRWESLGRALAGLASGVASGLLLRIPLAHYITESASDAVRWGHAGESAAYYGALLAARFATPAGAVEAAIVAGLVATCAVVFVIALRRGGGMTAAGTRSELALVAGLGVIAPLGSIVGAILLGTLAARYLQPVVAAPVLLIAALPALGSARRHSTRRRVGRAGGAGARALRVAVAALASVAAVAALGAGSGAVPRIVASVRDADSSVRCVDDWVNQAGVRGAGTYWTVRAPKAYASDPRMLVQIDADLNGYAWLVDRADYPAGAISFLVIDAQSTIPHPLDLAPIRPPTISCGRYTIVDYRAHPLHLGPTHS